MSLEKALEANTAAVLALTEMLAKEVWRAPAPEVTTKKPQEKAAAPSKATSAPAAETPASTGAAPLAATSTLTYDDIKTPFLELAKRDLEAAKAVLAELKLGTLKDAKPEQYAEILEKLNAIEVA